MSKTTVVNLGSGAVFNVYIGRASPRRGFMASKWANPFKIVGSRNRERAVTMYEEYIRNAPELWDDLLELDGKVLGCWCKPLACHGDVLVKLIEERKLSSNLE